jgi:hypothetical protein
LSDAQVEAILEFLNDCTTTFDLLDTVVGLDSDAADNLIEVRDGGDAECGSRDDGTFTTLDEVDAVTQVGDQTILDILSYIEGGKDQAGEWEGVSFTASEQASALDIANHASETQLSSGAGLPSDAVSNIFDARPIESMGELAAVPQVGESALQKIKDYIAQWDG